MLKNTITVNDWGNYGGLKVSLFTLCNENNMQVSISDFGATLQSILIPDKAGGLSDVLLGYDNLQGYIDDPYYMGGVVGRYANRIAGGLVELHGLKYQLSVTPGGFHHHGGKTGFNKKIWTAMISGDADQAVLDMEYISADGEEGFPGTLHTRVRFKLTSDNELLITYKATTDKTTLINLTQHPYFNLTGKMNQAITGHLLEMPMKSYLPVNAMQVPRGDLAPVAGTPFDFRKAKAIGENIEAEDEQLLLSAGYDHSWVIKSVDTDELVIAASILEPESGRALKIYTTEPAIHLYTGNFILDASKGKNAGTFGRRTGFCLETQHFPDAPNHPAFPSAILEPGAEFYSRTVFAFS